MIIIIMKEHLILDAYFMLTYVRQIQIGSSVI